MDSSEYKQADNNTGALPFGTMITIAKTARRHYLSDHEQAFQAHKQCYTFDSAQVAGSDGREWRYRCVTVTGRRFNVYTSEVHELGPVCEGLTIAALQM